MKYLLLILLLNAFIHLPFINEPPRSRHAWRQTLTLSVARNFYHEEMNIMHPRIDNRGATDGITGTQFPSYEFGLSALYKVAGEHFYISRIYALLIFSMGICFLYLWLLTISGNSIFALTGAWIFCWSPELFYHGFNALPDVLCLTATAGSLFFSAKYSRNNGILSLMFSFLLLLLAGLTKLQFLMAGAVWLYIFFLNKTSAAHRIYIAVSSVTVIALTLLWYHYAVEMIHKSGLNEVGLEFRPEQSWNTGWKIIKHNLISDIPETLIGYGSLLFFLTGTLLFFVRRRFKEKSMLPFIIWLIVFIAYYFIELAQMDEHVYYLLPLLPLLVLIAAYGADYIYSRNKTIFIVLIIALPVLTCIRIIPVRWMSDNDEVPAELLHASPRDLLIHAADNNDLCILLGDESNCIWFYFLEKKGWSVFEKEKLKENIRRYVDAGAKILYSREELQNDETLKPYLSKKLLSVGEFRVYSLHHQ
jgi:hypothetical protein